MLLAVLAKSLVFGQAHESGLSFLYQEAEVIGARLHSSVSLAFLLTASVMLFSTQVGVLESSSRIISENLILIGHQRGRKVNLSQLFYIALWAQIGLGIVVYLAGFQEPRLLLTLSAVLNGAAMMMAFPLIFWLNKTSLDPCIQPKLIRKALLAVAFVFFACFLTITVNSAWQR